MSRPRRWEGVKVGVYFPTEQYDEIEGEAVRQERSRSWIVQQAWKKARQQIATWPNAPLGPKIVRRKPKKYRWSD